MAPSNLHRNNEPPSKSSSPSSPSSSNKPSDHKNEGFLKSAWHKLTHQHDDPEPDNNINDTKRADGKNSKDTPSQDEEPKKASGSG
jgi:molecular chaperone DnaJ